jgi:hypothetical protein
MRVSKEEYQKVFEQQWGPFSGWTDEQREKFDELWRLGAPHPDSPDWSGMSVEELRCALKHVPMTRQDRKLIKYALSQAEQREGIAPRSWWHKFIGK